MPRKTAKASRTAGSSSAHDEFAYTESSDDDAPSMITKEGKLLVSNMVSKLSGVIQTKVTEQVAAAEERLGQRIDEVVDDMRQIMDDLLFEGSDDERPGAAAELIQGAVQSIKQHNVSISTLRNELEHLRKSIEGKIEATLIAGARVGAGAGGGIDGGGRSPFDDGIDDAEHTIERKRKRGGGGLATAGQTVRTMQRAVVDAETGDAGDAEVLLGQHALSFTLPVNANAWNACFARFQGPLACLAAQVMGRELFAKNKMPELAAILRCLVDDHLALPASDGGAGVAPAGAWDGLEEDEKKSFIESVVSNKTVDPRITSLMSAARKLMQVVPPLPLPAPTPPPSSLTLPLPSPHHL
jgi:hypothetical protein